NNNCNRVEESDCLHRPNAQNKYMRPLTTQNTKDCVHYTTGTGIPVMMHDIFLLKFAKRKHFLTLITKSLTALNKEEFDRKDMLHHVKTFYLQLTKGCYGDIRITDATVIFTQYGSLEFDSYIWTDTMMPLLRGVTELILGERQIAIIYISRMFDTEGALRKVRALNMLPVIQPPITILRIVLALLLHFVSIVYYNYIQNFYLYLGALFLLRSPTSLNDQVLMGNDTTGPHRQVTAEHHMCPEMTESAPHILETCQEVLKVHRKKQSSEVMGQNELQLSLEKV
ncbi:hypothetical protein L9F63_014693, partial [Diploptera punctata]